MSIRLTKGADLSLDFADFLFEPRDLSLGGRGFGRRYRPRLQSLNAGFEFRQVLRDSLEKFGSVIIRNEQKQESEGGPESAAAPCISVTLADIAGEWYSPERNRRA
jgi:hypothetical protein